jgi:hypothetical protein
MPMTNIIIYESAMCCSSGVCGPSPDKALIELQDTIEKVKKMGCAVERYSITQSPKKFRENPAIIKLIQEQQIKALPITTYNGRVMKVGSYPCIDELQQWLQSDDAKLTATTAITIVDGPCCSTTEPGNDEGCCAGQSSCDIRCGPNYKNSLKIDIKGKCC